MREVSCRTFERIERVVGLHGLRIEDLVAGLPITLEDLRDPTEWMDWEVFAELCDRFERATSAESSIKSGYEIWNLAYGAPLRRIAGLAIDLHHLYRMGIEWRLPKVHRSIGVRVEKIGSRRVDVELSIPKHLRGCEAWLRMIQGALESAPVMRGLPLASVDAAITPHYALYRVTLPKQRGGPLAWVRTVLGKPALAELDRQIEELRRLELERSRMDRVLRERERTLSNLIANLSGMVYRCRADAAWTLDLASQGCHGLTEYRSDEVVNNSVLGLAALVHPDDLERLRRQRDAALAVPRSCSNEYRIRTRSGGYVWVLDVAQPIYDAAEQHEGFEGFITDISERKRAQEVEKRLQDDLSHSRRLESLGRLAGGIAHDFNNWLTVISANVQMASAALDVSHPVRDRVVQIGSAASRASELTQEILAFARKQETQPRVIDLNSLVQGLDDMLRRALAHGIELTFVATPDVWPVEIDPRQFEQVLLNLALNARDAMPRGGRFTIETANVIIDVAADEQSRSDLPPGCYAMLSVTDNGTGMSEETRARVFEPFFTTKEMGEGTGLGLASAHGIVHQAHGEIQCLSALGAGTSFRIYLPRARGHGM